MAARPKQAFVHTADLAPDAGADPRAPGGAITAGLCGHWEHAGPCRWPHRTEVTANGPVLGIRTVFVAPPEEAGAIRGLIVDALRAGELATDGSRSRWALLAEGPGALSAADADLAASLARARREP